MVPRLPGVLQEEGVVGERRHGDAHLTQVVEVLTAVTACMTAYLTQVVEILDDRGLPQEEAVGDGLTHHEGGHQVLHGSGLAAVRTEVESVEAAL